MTRAVGQYVVMNNRRIDYWERIARLEREGLMRALDGEA